MSDPPLEITLQLLGRGRELVARLTFLNKGKTPYRLEKYNVDASSSNYFEVKLGGKVLRYTGRVKRVRGDLLVELAPGRPVASEVSIEDRYAFPPGKNTYTAQYKATHVPVGSERLVKLRSNVVTFEHSR